MMMVGLDDYQARQLAELLDLHVIGTPGVLLRAKRAGLLPLVRPELDALKAQGFRLTIDLYRDVLALAEEG
jgi:predicted nucleic acid-binding protein